MPHMIVSLILDLSTLPPCAGIASDGAGGIAAVDTFHQVVRRVVPSGMVSSIAGTVGLSLFGSVATNGLAGTSARLNKPLAVWGDPVNGSVVILGKPL